MKKFIAFVFGLFIMSSFIQAQDLDEILSKHFEAIGQDKLVTIQSMVNTGKAMQMGSETAYTVFFKRPNKFRLEVDIQGQKLIQAFDGEKGWIVMPWSGTTDPQELPAEQVKFMKWQADIDGMLYNWKEKGYNTELMGKEDMEGTEVYKIKQTMQEGDVFYYYIDAESYIMLKSEVNAKFQGNEINEETYNSNFKEVEGMVLPFNVESRSGGQINRQIVSDKYEFNTDLDDALFTMPEKKATETQPQEQK